MLDHPKDILVISYLIAAINTSKASPFHSVLSLILNMNALKKCEITNLLFKSFHFQP